VDIDGLATARFALDKSAYITGVGVARDWYHSAAYENDRHRHLGRLRGCDRRKRKRPAATSIPE
jgi:hypothetical protein